jgi:hypothetical protein
MESSRLDRVRIDVAGEIVEISWDERDTLLERLERVAGCETIVERFEAVGASRPVNLDDEQRSRLRVTLELWGVSVMPDGLMRLLLALVRADPGGHVGTAFVDG